MHIPWEDLEVFLNVGAAGSLSGAARAMGITQPTVSRRLAALEARVNKKLFVRDAEGARLTDEGSALWPTAEQMGRLAGQWQASAEQQDASPTGTVRIGTSPWYGFDYLLPLARELQKNSTKICLELSAMPRQDALAHGTIDLLLSEVSSGDPLVEEISKHQIAFGAFASKSYARKFERRCEKGTRPSIADIDWIGSSIAPADASSPTLLIDDPQARIRALEAGLGAGLFPQGLKDLSPLVPLDLDTGAPPRTLLLLANRQSARLLPVRIVIEALGGLLCRR